jgi:ATP-binding cassette subfamily C protein CydC
MAHFDPALGQALLVMLILADIIIPAITRLLSQKPGQHAVLQRTKINTELIDFIQGMGDLIVFGQAHQKLDQINSLSLKLGYTQWQMGSIFGLQSGLITFMSNFGVWLILTMTIPLVHKGYVDGVYLAVLSLAALTSFEAITPLPLAAQYLESNLQSARRLYEVVDAEPEVQDPPLTIPVPTEPFDLTIKNLSFHYPSENIPIKIQSYPIPIYAINELNINIKKGKKIAIVGPSGSGKSTIINLLLRFWEYHEGEIHLNGQDYRKYAQDELRRTLAVVSQNTYLFNASLRDNLRIANPKVSDDQIILAVKRAQIYDFIQSLPQGFDTWIGEQGMRLSVGERQRIALARALLKDSPFLILDEATANLDAHSERQILGSILSLFKGRTILLISHRLVEMGSMDEILVLDQGRLLERGNHKELVEANGYYRRMLELQNQVLIQ